MKNVLSVLPILSAVFFAVLPLNEMDTGTPNADTGVLYATDRSFAPVRHW